MQCVLTFIILCIYVFRFDRDSMVSVSGVDSIKYSLYPDKTFSNTEPGCFNGDNLSYGVHNSTGCKGGDATLKTFVSLPHFLGADPEFVDQFTPGMNTLYLTEAQWPFVEGSLRPDDQQHSASITVQESTSIPTEVLMRLQIILQLAPNPNIGSFFTNLRPVLLPVLWFDARAAITDDIADQLKLLGPFHSHCKLNWNSFFVELMPCAAEVVGVLCVLCGLVLFLVFLFITYKQLTAVSQEEKKSQKQWWTTPRFSNVCIFCKLLFRFIQFLFQGINNL